MTITNREIVNAMVRIDCIRLLIQMGLRQEPAVYDIEHILLQVEEVDDKLKDIYDQLERL